MRNEGRALMWEAGAALATVGLMALGVLGFAPFAEAADGGAVAKTRRGPVRVEAALGHGKLLAGVTTVDLGDLAAGQTVTVLAELAVEAGATGGSGPVPLVDVETRLTSVVGKALSTRSRLAAGITQDRKAVVASINRAVAERAVTVVAQADLDRAMDKWQQGDRAGAEKIIRERQAALSKDAKAMPSAAPAAAAQARVLGGALDDVKKAEEAGRSEAKQDAIKRRRADAYEAQL